MSYEFVGMARMVFIYGRKYSVIFLEINSSEENSRGLPQPQQTSDRFLC